MLAISLIALGIAATVPIILRHERKAREDGAHQFAHGDHPHLPRQLIRLGSFHADGDTL